jgi:hypothetical protein
VHSHHHRNSGGGGGTVANSSSAVGIIATAKSTPNVHSHHYRDVGGGRNYDEQQRWQLHFAAEDQNELSMIDEDESTGVGGSLYGRHARLPWDVDDAAAAPRPPPPIPRDARVPRPPHHDDWPRSRGDMGRRRGHARRDGVTVRRPSRAHRDSARTRCARRRRCAINSAKEIVDARKEWSEICVALKLEGEEDPVVRTRRDPSARGLDASWTCSGSMRR